MRCPRLPRRGRAGKGMAAIWAREGAGELVGWLGEKRGEEAGREGGRERGAGRGGGMRKRGGEPQEGITVRSLSLSSFREGRRRGEGGNR